jgi:predicted RNA-binding Zn-ribbon protein involved in translation (DUF1610 family)
MDTLFDLRDFSEKRICATCGKEFLPTQKPQRFCCPKCKRVFFQRKEGARIEARYESIQDKEVPLPTNLTERVKEAVKLYLGIGRKKRLGIRAIANLHDVSHVQIRRDLIEAGVYKPTPEQNRRARAGTGLHSRILQRQRIELRREELERHEKEWRKKMALCLRNLHRFGISIKTTCDYEGWKPAKVLARLSERPSYQKLLLKIVTRGDSIQDYRQNRIWRNRMAICLRALRHGKPVETTCREHGWNPSAVGNYLYRRQAYKKWKAAHPAKAENARQYKNQRKYDWRSNKYETEKNFGDAINQLLNDFGIHFSREKTFQRSRSRVDFELEGAIHIECKICTKPSMFVKAIGQALHSKAAKKEIWLVIPDDVKVHQEQLETLRMNQIEIFHETGLRQKLAGQEPMPIQTRTSKLP